MHVRKVPTKLAAYIDYRRHCASCVAFQSTCANTVLETFANLKSALVNVGRHQLVDNGAIGIENALLHKNISLEPVLEQDG